MNRKWVFDLETYPNLFSFSVVRDDNKFANTFEVSNRKNELSRILACIDYVNKEGDYLSLIHI